MSNILTKATVLVLNRNWQAINVRTPQEAFCMMATNVATGLEIEGEFPGLMAHGGKAGEKVQQLTDLQLAGARAGLTYLVEEGRALGHPVTHVWAHRQSSKDRRSDPGEEIWDKVVLKFAVPVLGLKTEPARVLEDGRPIPVEWDITGKGHF